MPSSTRRRARAWLLGCATLLSAGCVPAGLPSASDANPRPALASAAYIHAVAFPSGSAELAPPEAIRLRAFVASLPPGRPLRVGVAAAGDGAPLGVRRRETVEAALARLLPPTAEVQGRVEGPAPATPPAGDSVEVRVDAGEVVLPACPDWSRDPGFDPRNLGLSNLGCANAVNLGLMLANPADLAPGGAFGPADGAREAEAIARYRADKVRQLQADVLQP